MVERWEFSESEADELVVRARTQGQALAWLYERMVDSVYRFCVVRVADKAAAEDICSEVFLDVARTMRSFRVAIEAQGDWKGAQQVDRYHVLADRIEVTSTVTFLTCPEEGAFMLRLPYQEASLVSVREDDAAISFEIVGKGNCRTELSSPRPAQLVYQWTLRLSDLDYNHSHYQALLQSTLPVKSYRLEVVIDPEGPWRHFKEPDKQEWTAFSIGKAGMKTRFGTCGLGIKARE